MDEILLAKINNIISELQNQLKKDYIDTSTSKALMKFSISRLQLLLTHTAYLESRLTSTIESNKVITAQAESLIAENQRLSQIAKY